MPPNINKTPNDQHIVYDLGITACLQMTFQFLSSIFLKFLERIVCNRVLSFLNSKLSVLANNHYRFRKNHSTDLALIHLRGKLSPAIDKGEFSAVFISTCLKHLLA